MGGDQFDHAVFYVCNDSDLWKVQIEDAEYIFGSAEEALSAAIRGAGACQAFGIDAIIVQARADTLWEVVWETTCDAEEAQERADTRPLWKN